MPVVAGESAQLQPLSAKDVRALLQHLPVLGDALLVFGGSTVTRSPPAWLAELAAVLHLKLRKISALAATQPALPPRVQVTEQEGGWLAARLRAAPCILYRVRIGTFAFLRRVASRPLLRSRASARPSTI